MKKSILVGTALASALLLAACSGTPSGPKTNDGTSAGPATMTKISVAETAGAPSAFMQYGVDQGFFKDEGLDVTVDVAAGGAAAIPGLIGGNYQFAGSNAVSVLLAASKGLPLTIVAAGTRADQVPEKDFSAVLVSAGSPIKTPADLAGKTIAVNTLQNVSEITVRAALENEGVDTGTIKFIEMGFPDMLPAITNNQVDAAMPIEPFVTTGLAAGDRAIIHPYVQSMPGLMVGSYVTTKQYLASNAAIVEAFRRAVETTGAAIAKDPAAFRKDLPNLVKVQPEAAAKMNLPVWKSEVDVKSLEFFQKRMLDYGLITKTMDLSSVVAPPGK
jgi:NitT/TauT family transport system substrate-binding protein